MNLNNELHYKISLRYLSLKNFRQILMNYINYILYDFLILYCIKMKLIDKI
jgi:hypothetical protein